MTSRLERGLQKKAADVWGDHYKYHWRDINEQEEDASSNLYKILKYACEVGKKARQGTMLWSAKFKIREWYFMKNAFADIQWFMRAIQHQMGGEIT